MEIRLGGLDNPATMDLQLLLATVTRTREFIERAGTLVEKGFWGRKDVIFQPNSALAVAVQSIFSLTQSLKMACSFSVNPAVLRHVVELDLADLTAPTTQQVQQKKEPPPPELLLADTLASLVALTNALHHTSVQNVFGNSMVRTAVKNLHTSADHLRFVTLGFHPNEIAMTQQPQFLNCASSPNVGSSSGITITCTRLTADLVTPAAQCLVFLLCTSDPLANACGLDPSDGSLVAVVRPLVEKLSEQGLSWVLCDSPPPSSPDNGSVSNVSVFGLLLLEDAQAPSCVSTLLANTTTALHPLLALFAFFDHLKTRALMLVPNVHAASEEPEKATANGETARLVHVVYHGVGDVGARLPKPFVVSLGLAIKFFAHHEARSQGFSGRIYRDSKHSFSPVDNVVCEAIDDPSEFTFRHTKPFAHACSPGAMRCRARISYYSEANSAEDLFEQGCFFTALHTQTVSKHECARLTTLMLFALFKQATVGSASTQLNGSPNTPNHRPIATNNNNNNANNNNGNNNNNNNTQDVVAQLKWEAWMFLDGMASAEAKEQYVMLVTTVVPHWRQVLVTHKSFTLPAPQQSPLEHRRR